MAQVQDLNPFDMKSEVIIIIIDGILYIAEKLMRIFRSNKGEQRP